MSFFMSKKNPIKLQTSCILNVPFYSYEKDFTFVVNNKEFKTSKIVSDLISPYISKIHSNDPTFDRFIINTKQRGDFSNVLKLLNFETNSYSESELPFLFEVICLLGNDNIETEESKRNAELTIDNIFINFGEHEKYSQFYHTILFKEIDFISSHISEILEKEDEELAKVSPDTLYLIFTNDELQLKNEDQLLKFINKLYTTDVKYSILYETVLFENVSREMICEFISIFDSEFMTHNMWECLSKRICKEIKNDEKDNNKTNKRYKKENQIKKGISFSKENEYDGIINYLRKKSNNIIENEINITASSIINDDERYQPKSVTFFDDHKKYFYSRNQSNNWICFDFKKNRIIPNGYSLRSYPSSSNCNHPKSWVIECSNDNSHWETVDDVKDCPYLNGKNYSHTFSINNLKSKEFRYFRMRLTGPNWYNSNYFELDSFEIYGQFI